MLSSFFPSTREVAAWIAPNVAAMSFYGKTKTSKYYICLTESKYLDTHN